MEDASTGRDQEFYRKYYWSVDVPGLTQERAESLVAYCPELPGTVIDPGLWFTVHMDRDTAEVLRTALLSLGPDSIGVGLRESVDDWLDSIGPKVYGN